MPIKLEVSCAQCNAPPIDLFIERPSEFDQQDIRQRLELLGWVIEFNGSHVDTYCSPECAE